MTNKRGSIRQRGRDAWELRIYQGVDPDTGRQRYATAAETLSDIIATGERGSGGGHKTEMAEHLPVT